MCSLNGRRHRELTILLCFTFFMVTGFGMIMPLVIGYFVNEIGLSATVVALALAVRQFAQQGFAVIGGMLADRFDLRILINVGVLIRSIGFASLAYASDLVALFLSMVLIGVGGVLFETPYQTALAALTSEGNRPRFYSINNMIVGLASTIGPLLGAYLLRFDFQAVCYSAALCFLVTFIISCMAMPAITRANSIYSVKDSIKAVASDRPYLIYTVLMILFWLAASQINIVYPLHIQEMTGSAESVGLMFAVYAAVTAILQYPIVTTLLRKCSPRLCVVLGNATIAAAILLTSLAANLFAFLLVVVLFTLGMLISRPNQQTLAVEMANPRALGLYLGVNSLGLAIGGGLGTIAGGAVLDLSQSTGFDNLPWVVFSGISFISMLGFMLYKQIAPSKPVEAESIS